jgi:hypothetical protein
MASAELLAHERLWGLPGAGFMGKLNISSISGVYGFVCIPIQELYIGQSVNLYSRIGSHLAAIQHAARGSRLKHWHNYYDLEGWEAFEVHILERCRIDYGVYNAEAKWHLHYRTLRPEFAVLKLISTCNGWY